MVTTATAVCVHAVKSAGVCMQSAASNITYEHCIDQETRACCGSEGMVQMQKKKDGYEGDLQRSLQQKSSQFRMVACVKILHTLLCMGPHWLKHARCIVYMTYLVSEADDRQHEGLQEGVAYTSAKKCVHQGL